MNLLLVLASTVLSAAVGPVPEPELPGQSYTPPDRPTAAGAPLISSFTEDAGPDESFLLVGEGLSDEVVAWGADPNAAGGREIKPKVQFVKDGVLCATLPDRAYDGPVVVWAKNKAGYSEPVVLNAPNPWWCSDVVEARGDLHIFGRNLARRPSFSEGMVYLAQPGKAGRWLEVRRAGKYRLTIGIPADMAPGEYQLWVHAGRGGRSGWGGPLGVVVQPARSERPPVEFKSGDLQDAVNRLAAQGGGTLQLPAGKFPLPGTLIIPSGVSLNGMAEKSVLQAPHDPAARLATIDGSAWNQGPGGIHTVGDKMAYRVRFPAEGVWTVWLRYATDMAAYKRPGVSKAMVLAADGGEPVPLDNLPNTGSFGAFKWSKSAALKIAAGQRELLWQNVQGGGIHIDAFVFALDADYTPSDNPLPTSSDRVVVVQGEDVARFEAKDGSLPGTNRAVVWLAGDGASIANLTVLGSSRTNVGIAVRSSKYPAWIGDCSITNVTVGDVEGKQAENCAVRLFHADRAEVKSCQLAGRVPLFLSGVRRGTFYSNRLYSHTFFGGNAEAYLLGRNETVRECMIEGNVFCCPAGAEGGGPTGRRMIWLSTGRGSVDRNWIANNYEDKARFGGVAGTDQNVGEMILFEACERFAYFGPAAAAEENSVTLPAKLPPTPDDRLGSVKREQLAHDAAGNETPYWPPDVDRNDGEPTADEYFVTVLRGRGWGQTRKVTARRGESYLLDRPWRVTPAAGSLILVHTAYWRNHIVGNRAVDGMTGIQLWISCIENVLSDNDVARQRKPGLYLYGNCTTLASSMPCTWNRGIGPLFFNHIESTRCDETSCGALVISGEDRNLPVEFTRCLGNVLRHNSFTRSRSDGVLITGSRRPDEAQPASVVLGTVAEFNMVRDARVGYRAASAADGVLFRRNHAYFWYPVSNDPEKPVGFQMDNEKATAVLEVNEVEGPHGGQAPTVIGQQRGPRK